MFTKNKFGPKEEVTENILPSLMKNSIIDKNSNDKSLSSVIEAEEEEEEKSDDIKLNLPKPTIQSPPKGIHFIIHF